MGLTAEELAKKSAEKPGKLPPEQPVKRPAKPPSDQQLAKESSYSKKNASRDATDFAIFKAKTQYSDRVISGLQMTQR